MLIRFTDDYIADILAAYQLVGDIQYRLSEQEKFMGNSRFLDKLHAQSIVLSGIIDHLEHEDNSDPKSNEALLLCLRSLRDKNICGKRRNSVKFVENLHVTSVTTPTIQTN